MGYWETSPSGHSFSGPYSLPDGSVMLWGDTPADDIDHGLHRLIERFTEENGRAPTVQELDNLKFGTEDVAQAPEIVSAIKSARESFYKGVGRLPFNEEIEAGLRFSDSAITLGEG